MAACLPLGHAMNDYASQEECQYQSLQEALDLVQQGYFMAKIDLKLAYRSVRIHPSNHQATGLQWTFEGDTEPTYLIDTWLPFGSRKAPAFFNRLTQGSMSNDGQKGHSHCCLYLDDFFVIGATKADCQHAFNTLFSLLRKLGFYISYSKLICPTTSLSYLGFQVNSDHMTVALPAGKLRELQSNLEQFSIRKRATCKKLQSLAGKLNWACQVIKGG